jgi:hypothetical protein
MTTLPNQVPEPNRRWRFSFRCRSSRHCNDMPNQALQQSPARYWLFVSLRSLTAAAEAEHGLRQSEFDHG